MKVTSIARIIGPIIIPINPKNFNPPTTPSSTRIGCNPPLLPIILGLRILSIVPITKIPEAKDTTTYYTDDGYQSKYELHYFKKTEVLLILVSFGKVVLEKVVSKTVIEERTIESPENMYREASKVVAAERTRLYIDSLTNVYCQGALS